MLKIINFKKIKTIYKWSDKNAVSIYFNIFEIKNNYYLSYFNIKNNKRAILLNNNFNNFNKYKKKIIINKNTNFDSTINKINDNNLLIVNRIVTNNNKNNIGLVKLKDSKNFKHIEKLKINTIITDSSYLRTIYHGSGFDTMNTILYDNNKKIYSLYTRYNEAVGKRKIQMYRSNDLIKWSRPIEIIVSNGKTVFYIYNYNIFTYKNMYIGIFRAYINVPKNRHVINDLRIIIGMSIDGINFNVFNKNIMGNLYCVNGHIIKNDKIFFCISDKNNQTVDLYELELK